MEILIGIIALALLPIALGVAILILRAVAEVVAVAFPFVLGGIVLALLYVAVNHWQTF